MEYEEILIRAKEKLEKCKVCSDCDCKVCSGKVPGPGGKGSGSTAQRNREFWRNYVKLNQDVIYKSDEINTEVEFLGQKFTMPVYVAPIGMLELNWGGKYDDYTYSEDVISGADMAGTFAFTGGGATDSCFYEPLKAIENLGKAAVPTIKPWRMKLGEERIKIAEKSNPIAIAMDVDSAGLPHSNASLEPMMAKSVEDIENIVKISNKPFIVKGIMTAKSAKVIADTGIYAIVVSNHGGRVMDDGLATGEVLEEIREAIGDKVKVLVDGGIRTGGDVIKALALGADGVLIGRPCTIAAYGGGAEGVYKYLEKIKNEIKDTMKMIGCNNISEINKEHIFTFSSNNYIMKCN